MNAPKMPVKCGVDSCKYWKEHVCNAKAIEVNPMTRTHSAHTSEETQCTTFIPRT